MKEKEFIEIIKHTLNSNYIGDDCAYLKDLGIVITQDNLVEGIHFSLDFATPYQLGWKSAMVNISDVCASGAEPKYLTVGLSLPADVGGNFVEEFYKGLKAASGNIEIVGGDITGSDKVFISVAAIGSTSGRKISSRKNAKAGYKIITSGEHGASAAGLRLLYQNREDFQKFINAHLMPSAQIEFSKKIAESVADDYAMMDTSDGLMDALSQIAEASGVNLEVDFEKIPYDKDLEKFPDFRDLIFYGGEDYQIIAAVPEYIAKDFNIIGEVKKGSGVTVIEKEHCETFSKSDIEQKLFNHFEK